MLPPDEFIRKIIHIDMDAFYASVEQRDNPALRGKPVAVGGNKKRGVVAAASYEARAFGVRSAMPAVVAARKCPDLIFVPPHFEKYKAVSQQIQAIFFQYTDLVEPLALDEAFLDVTENKMGALTATKIAKEIRQNIFATTGLYASAGISINKFLAKVASGINKPNGQKTIMPQDALVFMEQLPVRKFFGVGEKTAAKMHSLNIFNGADLKSKDLSFLLYHFGKSGQHFFDIVRGIQKSQVQPHRNRKSLGAERTYEFDLKDDAERLLALEALWPIFVDRLERLGKMGKTITLKIKTHDFQTHTISHTFEKRPKEFGEIWSKIQELLLQNPNKLPTRLLGLSMSNFNWETKDSITQLTLEF